MEQEHSQQSFSINPERLISLVGSLIERPETPSIPIPPPGRWDNLIRQTLPSLLGPSPDPWLDRFARVALNPQPLPPRVMFMGAVARQFLSRAEQLHETASLVLGEERGIIIIGGYVKDFVDDWCGNGFRLVWRIPGPPPHWFPAELHGSDLLVMASQFADSAKASFGANLQGIFASGAAKLAQAGASRL